MSHAARNPGPERGSRSVRLRLLILAVSSAVCLALAEAALRRCETAGWGIDIVEYHRSDPLLGRRVRAHAPGQDARGFRNARVPERVDIVAIGDSHTRGFTVDREAAWPQVLGRRTGRVVYNMALGSYGPVHYELLAEEALELRPAVVVVGLYLGNDVWDAYKLVYERPAHRARRLPGPLLDVRVDPALARVGELGDERNRCMPPREGLRFWLEGRSALMRSLIRAGLVEDPEDARRLLGDRAWARDHPDHGMLYDDGKVTTVLNPSGRLPVLDLDEPRIAEGMRLSQAAIAGIASRCAGRGVRLLVLLIPTKESVYALAAAAERPLPEEYERLVEAENRARTLLTRVCATNDVPALDLLPGLRAAVAAGEAIYPKDTNGHPDARGQALYARLVQAELDRLEW